MSRPMMGQVARDRVAIAWWLAGGYAAEVVGGVPMAASDLGLMWVDEVLVQEPREPRLTAPGVRMTRDDDVILFATTTRERAETLLAEARELLKQVRG